MLDGEEIDSVAYSDLPDNVFEGAIAALQQDLTAGGDGHALDDYLRSQMGEPAAESSGDGAPND